MRFLDLNNLLHASTRTTCSKDEKSSHIGRSFSPGVQIDATELYSGWSYGEFRQRYAEKLQQSAKTRMTT